MAPHVYYSPRELSIARMAVVDSSASLPLHYGRAAGGIINLVYKSGTEHYHGEVFDFFRNSVLDTKNYFDMRDPASE